MAVALYIVPAALVQLRRTPKYFGDGTIASLLGLGWSAQDMGLSASFIVAADLNASQLSDLTANADVIAFPADQSTTVASVLATLTSQIEALNIPGNWMTSATTYRQLARNIIGVFRIMQQYQVIANADLFANAGGVTLNTTLGQLPTQVRQNLNAAAQAAGFDTSSLTLSMTIRQTLRTLAQQLNQGIQMQGITVG